MGTLGTRRRNGPQKRGQNKFPLTASAAASKAAHPAVAKLAVALREYKELAEQHAATAEILRVIANSTENAEAVFNAITRAGARLVPDSRVALLLAKDGQLHLKSYAELAAQRRTELAKFYPSAVDASTVAGAAVLKKAVVHLPDLKKVARQYPLSARMHAKTGSRAMLAAPLMSRGRALGTVVVTRIQPGAFSRRQIALVRTFADQAVIAIENARLFNETKEALEHQKASADILRIVASSVESTDPVFRAITEAGMRLVPGCRVALHLLRDGQLQYVSHSGVPAEHWKKVAKFYPIPVPGAVPSAIAVAEKRVVHVPDIEKAGKDFALGRRIARVSGWRSILSVPLMRGKEAIGNIAITRAEPGPFTDKQIALLQTFADQAVIAIENAKMFRELLERNLELKQSLDFQGASGEILAAISSSVTDTQPVFDAIAQNTRRLLDTSFVAVSLLRGDELDLIAATGDEVYLTQVRAAYPWRLKGADGALATRAVRGREIIHVCPIRNDPHAPEKVKRLAAAAGYNSILMVPMLRQGVAVGMIATARRQAEPFDEKQIALIKSFADQAVIAIENARLFNETKEALERQTATAEVLRVISRSPDNIEPVFDSILEHAMRLCDANLGSAGLYDGKTYRHIAARGSPEYVRFLLRGPFEPGPGLTRMIAERKPLHVPDYREVASYRERNPRSVATVEIGETRTYLAVPLLKEGRVIGGLVLRRAEVRPFSQRQIELVTTFADQAVIAIENARLFNETKEALEQQTGTAQVLSAISGSPTDVAPVYQTILENATRLCEASFAVVFLYDGEYLRAAAYRGASASFAEHLDEGRFRPSGETTTSLAALEKRIVEVEDLLSHPNFSPSEAHRAENARAVLSVPMLREGELVGVVTVWRREPRRFTDKQIALLKTFADQAVIAIENVRLFNETKEALERQTATAEILRVISRSPTDTQPAFDAIVRSAVRLCAGGFGSMLGLEGDTITLRAYYNATPGAEELLTSRFPAPLSEQSLVALALRTGNVVHSPDTSIDPRASRHAVPRALGVRAQLTVPLLKEGQVIGALNVARDTCGPFSDTQIEMLKTFADQAVIAIENVRLFNETKEALEQQTGTTEILKVISQSPTDTKPVFKIIAERAVKLCDAAISVVARFDGKSIHLVASHGVNPKATEMMASVFPMRSEDETVMARTVRNRAIVHVADVLADATYSAKHVAAAAEYRSSLGVPMMRGGEVIGGIFVARARLGLFSDKQVALLQTFADQAVIAIENVRLFNETKEALDQQTATSEILGVISASPTDLAPVFDAILKRGLELCEAHLGHLHLYDGEFYRTVAQRGATPEFAKYIAERGPYKPEGVVLHPVPTAEPLQIPDLKQTPAYLAGKPNTVKFVELGGARTTLSVPLIKEGKVLGVLVIYRPEVRPFSEKQIALISLFASQAVIAIENVRLFNETKEALEQQTATAEILKVISSSTTDTQPVFEAIVQSAARLFAPCMVAVVMREGDVLLRKARAGPQPPRADQGAVATIYPLPFDAERSMAARSVIERRIIQVPDTEAEGLPPIVKSLGRAAGYRAITLVPLVKEGEGIGVIGLSRPEPGFKLTDKQLALVRTFADQAVIAIENVRLFKELQDRTEALTKSVGQLTALGQVGQAITSTLDLETVLKTIVSHAVKLTGLDAGAVYEYDEGTEEFHLRAAENLGEEILEVLRTRPIRKGDGVVGRTAVTREPMQIHDTQDESYQSNLRELVIRTGRRALLAVPLMREDHIIGALTVQRNTPGPFAPEVVELLKTFATQSAMAIQNARLYREIEQKSRELETASKHKSQFLASMSHELRTPLNAILGFNEMILDQVYGEVPQDVKAPLENIQSSGKHLLRLINNVLDLAKIEAGRMELALSEYSVQDTVASVHSTLKPLAAEKGLEFVAEVPADIPPAHGDAGRLAQCLMNLAGNSLKFTKEGRVSIAVGQDNGLLRFSVADTGIGIPADKIPNLFTEFKQTDATIASEYGGTGLGLSITKKFIEMHGGRIWVESEPGKGSTFLFEIPLRAAQ